MPTCCLNWRIAWRTASVSDLLEELETLVTEWTHDVHEFRRNGLESAAHIAQSNLEQLKAVIARERARLRKQSGGERE